GAETQQHDDLKDLAHIRTSQDILSSRAGKRNRNGREDTKNPFCRQRGGEEGARGSYQVKITLNGEIRLAFWKRAVL
ncbi:MAG: hypothetical protein IKS78_07495, partial [Clostridia bacterium]|nr:hypothetical protein [Clostridia bacterium]